MTVDVSKVGFTVGPVVKRYDWRDTALYALGLCAGTDDLGYLLDNPPPKVLPTFPHFRRCSMRSAQRAAIW